MKIKEYISLAMRFYNDFVKTLAILKLFFAIKIMTYFSQNFDLLDTTLLTTKHTDKINKPLDNMSFNIQVPKDAPYNERKLQSLFTEALEKKDFHGILGIMDYLSHHSNIFNKLNLTWEIFIQWIWFYDKEIVLNFLSRTQNFMNIEFVFQSLKNDIFSILPRLTHQTNCYTLLRGISIFFEELEHTPYMSNSEFEKIPDYSDFLINSLHEHQQEFRKYMQLLRISHLKAYNFTMGIVLAKNQKLLPFYIDFIDTTIQPSYAFSKGFLNNCMKFYMIYDKTAIDTMKNILSVPQEYRTIIVKNFSNEELKSHFNKLTAITRTII